MSSPLVFISYSHKDETWMNRVATHIGVSQQQGLLDLWHDRLIAGGDDWYEAIVGAIDSGCVAILLVSANSLTSDFIKREEIPRILQLRDEGRMRLFPIVISSCDWEAVDWLKRVNLRPNDGRALDLGTDAQINADLAKIAKEIRLLINRLSAATVTTTSTDGGEPQYRRIPTLPAPKLFVGRKDQLVEIEKKLRSGGAVGLVSLRGTAGVGKSALALESAYRFASLFPDGRYWVDLRGGDAANAARALLRDLGAANLVRPDSDFHELCYAARAELASRRALVILDNAEAIDPGHLERLTDLCATTIVTSRVSIDPTMEITVDRLEDDDALKLLEERGVDVAAERDEALKLIARLGGLALALEITARRMAIYRPHQSCAQALDDLNRSRHLVEAIRLPRHDTREGNIAEAFALSYRKLDDDLKSAFHALGLCAESGAPLEAVARMLEVETGVAHDLLLVLAEWSLADFGGKRAVVHPVLHSYAEKCAHEQSEQAAEMIELHVRYFAGEIGGEYQRAINDDRDYIEALNRTDLEMENVRLAQIRALEPGFSQPELALEVTDNLELYWRRRYVPDVLEWLQTARVLAQKTNQKQREANVLKAIGDVQSFRKEMDAALASYAEARTLFQQVGDKLGQANVRLSKGKIINSAEEFEEAIRLYEEIGHTYSIARGKVFFGEWLLDQGETERAIKLLGEAREGWALIGYDGGVDYVDEILEQAGKE
ncbi:MAG: TIR domain-containing protein [Blastocatellia bacterium]